MNWGINMTLKLSTVFFFLLINSTIAFLGPLHLELFDLPSATKMQLKFSVIFALLAVAAARKCGTPEPTKEQLNASAEMALQASNDASINEYAAAATLTINTYFHVLRSGTATSQGNIPDAQLYDQVCDFLYLL